MDREDTTPLRARNIEIIKREVNLLRKDTTDLKTLLQEIKGSLNLLRIRLDAHESKTDTASLIAPDPTEKIGGGWFW